MAFNVNGVDINSTFNALAEYVPQVALEMMSKSGNAVRDAQRKAMKSTTVHTVTRDGTRGRYLAKSNSPMPFGNREEDGKTISPDNMSSMITSYLMERSMVMVVNGSHGAFTPVTREDGKITGTGTRVNAVGKTTHAILQRMNDDTESTHYPKHTQLATKKKIGTHYAQKGINNASGKVGNYLSQAYLQAMCRVLDRERKQL